MRDLSNKSATIALFSLSNTKTVGEESSVHIILFHLAIQIARVVPKECALAKVFRAVVRVS